MKEDSQPTGERTEEELSVASTGTEFYEEIGPDTPAETSQVGADDTSEDAAD